MVDIQKRLEKLKTSGFITEKLTYDDLFFLLSHDANIKQKISSICHSTTSENIPNSILIKEEERQTSIPLAIPDNDSSPAISKPIQQMTITSTVVEHPLLQSNDITNILEAISTIKKDDVLIELWRLNSKNKGESDNDELDLGETFIRFCALAAQWQHILKLWDHLADTAKKETQTVTSAQLVLLNICLNIYNQTFKTPKATLVNVEVGQNYDYLLHQKIQGNGDTIDRLILPGLANAAVNQHKKPLVSIG